MVEHYHATFAHPSCSSFRDIVRTDMTDASVNPTPRLPSAWVMTPAWKTGHSWNSVFSRWSALAGWSWRPGWSSDRQLHRCLYDAVVAGGAAAVHLQLAVAVLAGPVTLATQSIAASSARLLSRLPRRLVDRRQNEQNDGGDRPAAADAAHVRLASAELWRLL